MASKSKNASPTLAGKIVARIRDTKQALPLVEDAVEQGFNGNTQVAEAGQEVAGQKPRNVTVADQPAE